MLTLSKFFYTILNFRSHPEACHTTPSLTRAIDRLEMFTQPLHQIPTRLPMPPSVQVAGQARPRPNVAFTQITLR